MRDPKPLDFFLLTLLALIWSSAFLILKLLIIFKEQLTMAVFITLPEPKEPPQKPDVRL